MAMRAKSTVTLGLLLAITSCSQSNAAFTVEVAKIPTVEANPSTAMSTTGDVEQRPVKAGSVGSIAYTLTLGTDECTIQYRDGDKPPITMGASLLGATEPAVGALPSSLAHQLGPQNGASVITEESQTNLELLCGEGGVVAIFSAKSLDGEAAQQTDPSLVLVQQDSSTFVIAAAVIT